MGIQLHDHLVPPERPHERNHGHGGCYNCFVRLVGLYMYLVMIAIIIGGCYSLYLIFKPEEKKDGELLCKLLSGDPDATCEPAVRQCYPKSTITLPSSKGQICGSARVCCASHVPSSCPNILKTGGGGGTDLALPYGGGLNASSVLSSPEVGEAAAGQTTEVPAADRAINDWASHLWISPAATLTTKKKTDKGVWDCCAKVLGQFVPKPMVWIWFFAFTGSFVTILLNLAGSVVKNKLKKKKEGDDGNQTEESLMGEQENGSAVNRDDDHAALLRRYREEEESIPFALRCFKMSTPLGLKTLITSLIAMITVVVAIKQAKSDEEVTNAHNQFKLFVAKAYNGPLAGGFTNVATAWVGFAAFHVWRVFDRDVVSGRSCIMAAFEVTLVACCIFAAMFLAPMVIIGPYLPCCFHWFYMLYVDIVEWMVSKRYKRVTRYILTYKHKFAVATHSFLILVILYPGWLVNWLPGALLFFPWWCAAVCCCILFFFIFGTTLSYVGAKCRLKAVVIGSRNVYGGGSDEVVDAVPNSACGTAAFEVLRVWTAVVLAALGVNYCLSGCVNVSLLLYEKDGRYLNSMAGYKAIMFQAFAMRSTACYQIQIGEQWTESVDTILMFL